MQKKHLNYYILPSVVKAGEISKVRIIPRAEQARWDNRFMKNEWDSKPEFPEEWFTHDPDAACKVKIVPLQNWYNPSSIDDCEEFIVKVNEDGGLIIEYFFDREQEYQIMVSTSLSSTDPAVWEKGGWRWDKKFNVYAVKEDLFGKRVYKGDLHVHSMYSDGCEDVDENAANYRAAGFDFMSLTDHFKRFPSLMMKEITDKNNFGLTVYPGEEVHVPNMNIHYVHVGGEYSVNEYYRAHREECQVQACEIAQGIAISDEKAREFASWLVWNHQEIKKARGLSIFPHPMWRWNSQNITDDMVAYVFENGLMDVFEILGGLPNSENNKQVALWTEYAINGKKYPIVGSSDSHLSYKEHHDLFNSFFSFVFAEDCTFENIKKAILNYENVAVENRTNANDVRMYGSFRYVNYAHFLWKEYFPLYEYFCQMVGNQMKMYFEGDEKALEVALNAQKRADDFAEQFFGRRKINL